MLTFTITWWQRYKGYQYKLYIQNKIWQNGDNHSWNNAYIYMIDRTTITEASEIDLILAYYHV